MVSNHPLFKGDSSPTYSLSFLEVGVFSPKTIKSNLRYRVTCDGFDSGWTDSDTIVINNLTTSGVKIATVLVSNNPLEPDKGAIAEDSIRFFKL